MSNEQIISEIVNFIESYGGEKGFFKTFFVYDGHTNSSRFTTTKTTKASYGSLKNYFNKQLEISSPKSVTITVKKYNGNSGGRDPKTETFHFVENEKVNSVPVVNNYSEVEQIKKDPYGYQMRMLKDQLDQEKKEKERYKNKHSKSKRALEKVKFKLATIEERTALENAKLAYDSENSLSGLADKATPILEMLIEKFTGNGATNNSEDNGLQGIKNPLKAGLIEMSQTLEGQKLQDYFEIFVRFANLQEEQFQSILNKTREVTPHLNEAIYEQLRNNQ